MRSKIIASGGPNLCTRHANMSERVGPWDASPEEGVLPFRASLFQELLKILLMACVEFQSALDCGPHSAAFAVPTYYVFLAR